MTDKEKIQEISYLCYQMWQGDDVLDSIVDFLKNEGFIDKNEEWIYEDE